ncbi:unnamed protein product [Echinostoma caproni]|uniref:WD_REPEATS_REGION domain-containing protein n=1 Tax=Echinostoma caproni TaxID=27848 RepID=A0A183AIJ6_9TREM|nr:unnamed protein product [Echinostoma caproni]
MTCSVFCAQPSPSEDPLVGGQFTDSNLMAVYCQSGSVLLYRVVPRLSATQQAGSSSSLITDPPLLLAKLSPNIRSPLEEQLASPASERGLCCFFLPESLISRPLLFGGTEWGTVVSWRLDAFLSPTSDRHPASVGKDCIPPTAYCDLSSVWHQHPPQRPLDLWEEEKSTLSSESPTNQDTITVCVQLLQMTCSRSPKKPVVHADRLAFGLSSGRIIVVRLTDFLQLAYCQSAKMKTSGPTGLFRFSRFSLEGHDGPVTCLLHPASVDDQYLRSLSEKSEEKPSTNNTPQFNPDHLLSGGADFAVRLWDLDPWRDLQGERATRSSAGDSALVDQSAFAPACLAVFRCHASPCLSLSIGPPSIAISQAAAGNPRLSVPNVSNRVITLEVSAEMRTACDACIKLTKMGCDSYIGARVGSMISLREQRVLLSTTPCNGVSGAPVTALGWRVPEDMLFVAHADGLLEVWDISVGCLDRLETDSGARDLFEQAHYVVEVQLSSASFGASLSQLSYQSAPIQAHHTRTATLVFAGCANNSHAAGSVLHTAPARLRRSAPLRRASSSRSHQPTILLHTIGLTSADMRLDPARSLSAGPAAFVFHWDTEAMIYCALENPSFDLATNGLDLLLRNEVVDLNNAVILSGTFVFFGVLQCSVDRLHEAATLSGLHCTALVKQLQLFIASLHPWGLDPEADHAALACVGSRERSQSDQTKSDVLSSPVRDNLCLGLPSKHGCLSLCLPGWSAPGISVIPSTTGRSVSRLYSLSHGISTNLMLAELSLCETLTSLDRDCAEQLLQLSDPSSRAAPLSLIIGDTAETSIKTELTCVRACWLQLAACLCGPLLAQCVWGSPRLQANQACRLPELEILVQKWQDRMIPIRYAARTLLFAYLDHMGFANRQLLVNKWCGLLPQFAMTQPTKPSTRNLHRQSTTQGLPACLQSVSLCSLDSAGLISNSVTDSHWWITLSGYRVSPREHARLQAIAIVFLGVIGCRFGTAVCRRHPAVSARDLIDDSRPIYQSNPKVDGIACNSGSNTVSRNPGLAAPCFASPDTSANRPGRKAQSSSDPNDVLTIESFTSPPDQTEQTSNEVPDGFGYANHQLARSTSPLVDTSQSSSENQTTDVAGVRGSHLFGERHPAPPAVTSNALVSLLMSNAHSSLRRACIDLLGRGFVVWEPYVDLGQLLNALLNLVVDAEQLLSE